MRRLALRPVGHVESVLTDPAAAPRQADEGAPNAWLVLEERFAAAGDGLAQEMRVRSLPAAR